MVRSLEIPKNGQHKTPKNGKPQVYNLRGTSPTGKMVVLSLGKRWPQSNRSMPPCLRGHGVTRLAP